MCGRRGIMATHYTHPNRKKKEKGKTPLNICKKKKIHKMSLPDKCCSQGAVNAEISLNVFSSSFLRKKKKSESNVLGD
jgi:hypothetical protein